MSKLSRSKEKQAIGHNDPENKERGNGVPFSRSRRAFLQAAVVGAPLLVCMGLGWPRKVFAAAKQPEAPPIPAKKPPAPRLLVLDPGHGGRDPGAIGLHGIQEKDITLDMGIEMASALADGGRVHIKMTRETDQSLALQERVDIARAAGADLFVSLHADSAPNVAARGLSCYTLSEKASDDLANALAEKENLADRLVGVDLSQADQEVAAILFDLSARRARNTSQRVKVRFVRAMARHCRLLENPMRSANFAVLRAPDMPSMLIESGFLSNPKDEALLRQPAMRKKLAHAMAREIENILDTPLFG